MKLLNISKIKLLNRASKNIEHILEVKQITQIERNQRLFREKLDEIEELKIKTIELKYVESEDKKTLIHGKKNLTKIYIGLKIEFNYSNQKSRQLEKKIKHFKDIKMMSNNNFNKKER